MPQFISLRRGSPETGYVGFENNTEDTGAATALVDGVPVFHRTDEGLAAPALDQNGERGVGGNDDATPLRTEYLGICSNNFGGGVIFGEFGLAQVWGYMTGIAKVSATDTAGDVGYVADAAVSVTFAAGTDATLIATRGGVVGLLMADASTTVPATAFLQSMGM